MSQPFSSLPFLTGRLKELRSAAGLTQSEFAEIVGMTAKVYQHIEAGRRNNPELRTLDRLAQAYGIELHELFGPELPKIKLAKRASTQARRRAPKRR